MKMYSKKEADDYLRSWGVDVHEGFLYKACAAGHIGAHVGGLLVFREDELDKLIEQLKERLTITQLGETIGYSYNGIFKMMRKGLPYTMFGGRYSFDIDEVLKWLSINRPERYKQIEKRL